MIFLKYLWEMLESAVNPLFFRKAVRHSAGRAFGYYLFFTTVYTLAICGAGFWWASRHWSPALDKAAEMVPAFEIRVDQGALSTTLPQPTFLGDDEFAFILDTKTPGGPAVDLTPYKTALVVGRTKAVVKKSAFESREYNFAALPDFRLTKGDAIAWLKDYESPILWSAFATMSLLVVPTLWLFLIPVILILMLLMMIPTKLVRSNLTYSQVVSIGFYAVTFPTYLQTYFIFRGHPGDGTVRWVYLVWCLVGILTAYGLGRPKPGAAPAAPSPPALPTA